MPERKIRQHLPRGEAVGDRTNLRRLRPGCPGERSRGADILDG